MNGETETKVWYKIPPDRRMLMVNGVPFHLDIETETIDDGIMLKVKLWPLPATKEEK